MARKKKTRADWVVLDGNDQTIKCQRCGESRPLILPATVSDFVRKTKAFSVLHEDCPKPCPFCGSEELGVADGMGVICLKCGCLGPVVDDYSMLATFAAWDVRGGPPSVFCSEARESEPEQEQKSGDDANEEPTSKEEPIEGCVPCPFCAGDSLDFITLDPHCISPPGTATWILCQNCGCCGPGYNTDEDYVLMDVQRKAWNSRTPSI